MDFSETYRFSGPVPVCSPCGKYIAAATEYRLVVRDALTTQVAQIYSCIDKISDVQWCPSSTYIMCGLVKRAIVQVWSVVEPDWTCKIDEGLAGAEAVQWSPDGLHILVTADFQIRITIWSLASKSFVYISGPKHATRGIKFSPDGEYMAVAERKECKDIISMYTCSNWSLVHQFPISTSDLEDLAWSPDCACLVAWDSCLTYKLVVCTPQGEILTVYSAYPNALGIKSVEWSPSGQMLAVGSFDQEARILNHATWSPLAVLGHPGNITSPEDAVVYKEVADISNAASQVPTKAAKSHYIVCQLPVKVTQQKVPLDKPNVRLGVGKVCWSKDGHYLVSINENMATTVWIWDMQKLQLAAVLLQTSKVTDVSWDTQQSRLLICTGSSIIYLWSPDGASCVHVPLSGFEACSAVWSPDGRKLVLSDRDAYCCAYLEQSK
ncbi:TPA: hypothetical protein ACH3X2_005718 [Trebouxia sp. C0005]